MGEQCRFRHKGESELRSNDVVEESGLMSSVKEDAAGASSADDGRIDEYNAPLSIIMPCYNVERYLGAVIESLRVQPYENWELIAVDDASTDGTAEALTRAARQDARVRPVHHDRNHGAAAARNTGLAHARGEYIWFLDPDDDFEPALLPEALGALEESDADVAVFGCREETYDAAGALRATRDVLPPASGVLAGDELHRAILDLEESTLYGYAWNKVYRREVIGSARFPDVMLAEDLLFNVEVFDHVTRAVFIPQPLYHYKKRLRANLTNRFDKNYYSEHRMRIEALYNQQVRWGLDSAETRSRLGSLYGRYIISALERNCDKRAEMSHADRVAWCRALTDDPLFTTLVQGAHSRGGVALEACLALIKTGRPALMLVLGRLVHVVRSRLGSLYAKLKRQR